MDGKRIPPLLSTDAANSDDQNAEGAAGASSQAALQQVESVETTVRSDSRGSQTSSVPTVPSIPLPEAPNIYVPSDPERERLVAAEAVYEEIPDPRARPKPEPTPPPLPMKKPQLPKKVGNCGLGAYSYTLRDRYFLWREKEQRFYRMGDSVTRSESIYDVPTALDEDGKKIQKSCSCKSDSKKKVITLKEDKIPDGFTDRTTRKVGYNPSGKEVKRVESAYDIPPSYQLKKTGRKYFCIATMDFYQDHNSSPEKGTDESSDNIYENVTLVEQLDIVSSSPSPGATASSYLSADTIQLSDSPEGNFYEDLTQGRDASDTFVVCRSDDYEDLTREQPTPEYPEEEGDVYEDVNPEQSTSDDLIIPQPFGSNIVGPTIPTIIHTTPHIPSPHGYTTRPAKASGKLTDFRIIVKPDDPKVGKGSGRRPPSRKCGDQSLELTGASAAPGASATASDSSEKPDNVKKHSKKSSYSSSESTTNKEEYEELESSSLSSSSASIAASREDVSRKSSTLPASYGKGKEGKEGKKPSKLSLAKLFKSKRTNKDYTSDASDASCKSSKSYDERSTRPKESRPRDTYSLRIPRKIYGTKEGNYGTKEGNYGSLRSRTDSVSTNYSYLRGADHGGEYGSLRGTRSTSSSSSRISNWMIRVEAMQVRNITEFVIDTRSPGASNDSSYRDPTTSSMIASHLTRLEVSMTRSGTLSSTLGDNLGLLIATVRFILRRTLEETERNMDTLINQLYSQLLELDLERVRLLITSDELSSYVKENFLANTRTEIKSRLKVILKDSYERYKGNINDIIKQATDRDADMSSQEFRERVNSIIDLIISMLTASISSTELAKIVLSTAKKRAHSFFKDKLNLE